VEPERDKDVQRPVRKVNPTLIALGGLLILLLLIWFFSSNRSADQDKLTGNEVTASASSDPEKRCSSKATYDLIKRELFRRAAQLRGSDQAAFDQLSAYATLRMENPVLESENSESGTINCSGSLSIDLPPGIAVVGGRRTLSTNIDYTLQSATDGSGDVVLLRNADAIVTPLATLARVAQAAPEPEPATDPLAPLGPGEEPLPLGDGVTIVRPEPAQPGNENEPRASARPSFNCGAARTRGEIAVCSDPALASLDRQMAAQFGAAMSGADSSERALLQRTRGRFLAYRDSCRSDGCIAEAYRGRIREIRDIMEGRWQPPR
jgi:uncharacterized protein YecT (DUF1311 family)